MPNTLAATPADRRTAAAALAALAATGTPRTDLTLTPALAPLRAAADAWGGPSRRTREALDLARTLYGRDGQHGRAAWRAAFTAARALSRLAAMHALAPDASTAAALDVLKRFGMNRMAPGATGPHGGVTRRAAWHLLIPFRDYTRRRGGQWSVARVPVLAP